MRRTLSRFFPLFWHPAWDSGEHLLRNFRWYFHPQPAYPAMDTQRRPNPCLAAVVAASFLSACNRGGDEVIQGAPTSSTALDLEFGLGYSIELGGTGLTDSLLADFDGNGSLELVHAGSLDGALHIATNVLPGDPEVTPLQTIIPGRAPLQLIEGDFDGDGLGGFAALCSDGTDGTGALGLGSLGQTEVVLYEIDEVGFFVEQSRFMIPGYALTGIAGNLFGGSRDQLLLADLAGGSIDVYELQVSSETFALAMSLSGPPAPPSTKLALPFSIELFDRNGDGLLDVAVGRTDLGLGGSTSAGRIEVLEQTSPGVFGAPLVLSNGMRVPRVEAVEDLDGDGLEDLVAYDLDAEAGDGDDASLRWFPSGSDLTGGELLLRADEQLGGVADVVVADPNGDGFPDLLVAQPQEMVINLLAGPSFQDQDRLGPVHEVRRLHRFPGNGPLSVLATGIARSVWLASNSEMGGSLQSAVGSPAGLEPALVVTGDLDLDGRPDAVVVDASQREVRFLRGAPDFRFESAGIFQLSSVGQETPGGIRLVDLDGDGDLDLGLAANTASTVVIMENTGTLPLGNSGDVASFPAGIQPIDLDFADFDGDGLLDIALSDAGASRLVLLRGIGPFEFEPWSEIPLPARPLAILAADLDGDDRPEIALTASNLDKSDPRLLVFAPTDSGPFPFSLVTFAGLSGVGARIRVGDIDGDGRVDIACGHTSSMGDGVTLLLAGADLTQFDVVQAPTGPGSSAFDLRDLDLDGDLDVVSARTDGIMGLVLGDGLGEFTLGAQGGVQPVVPTAATWLDFADLDGDLRPEILMVSPLSPHLWVAQNTSQ